MGGKGEIEGHIRTPDGMDAHRMFPLIKRFLPLVQEMYKASKYQVSPDLSHVLLAYNIVPVRVYTHTHTLFPVGF